MAGDGEEEIPDPLRIWSAPPDRVTSEAWSPYEQAVSRNAARAVRSAPDDPRGGDNSASTINDARDD
eukprot:5472-Pyramimonas_sp.AAC.1